MSKPGRMDGIFSRQASRNSRRIRLRSTAFLEKLLLIEKPIRVIASVLGTSLTVRPLKEKNSPFSYTLPKSRRSFNLFSLGSMPLMCWVNAIKKQNNFLYGKLFSSLLSSLRDDLGSGCSAHPFQEAMPFLPLAFFRLIGTFHDICPGLMITKTTIVKFISQAEKVNLKIPITKRRMAKNDPLRKREGWRIYNRALDALEKQLPAESFGCTLGNTGGWVGAQNGLIHLCTGYEQESLCP